MSKMAELDITVQNLSEEYDLPYEVVAKLLPEKDKLKLIYMWIKQEHINLKQFRGVMLLMDDIFNPR